MNEKDYNALLGGIVVNLGLTFLMFLVLLIEVIFK